MDHVAFATWALKRVSLGEFRTQYHKLLKLYKKEKEKK